MIKTGKSILLASAASLAVAGAAYAADLPVRKAPEKVFVEVCTNYEGFYRIPGTDTCLRFGGYVRMDWGYGGNPDFANIAWSRASSLQGSFSRLVLIADARPMTDYGPAQILIHATETVTTNGTGLGAGNPWSQPSNSTFVQQAFISLAGWRFGYAISNFDYLHVRYTLGSMMTGSSIWTTQIAYTGKIGTEWTWTVAAEDAGYRRYPILQVNSLNEIIPGPGTPPNSVPNLNYLLGNAGKSMMPDVVGRIQYRSGWGDIAVMGALHEVRPAYSASGALAASPLLTAATAGGFPAALAAAPGSNAGVPGFIAPDTKIGGAVQLGITIKTPGGGNPKIPDELAGQVAWSTGAQAYTLGCYGNPVTNAICSNGITASQGGNGNFPNNKHNFLLLPGDAVYNPATGALDLVDSWTAEVRYRHFWNPYWRTNIAVGVTQSNFSGPGIINIQPNAVAGVPSAPVGADFRIYSALLETIWSPYTDLDLAISLGWVRVDPQGPKVIDGFTGFFRSQWNF